MNEVIKAIRWGLKAVWIAVLVLVEGYFLVAAFCASAAWVYVIVDTCLSEVWYFMIPSLVVYVLAIREYNKVQKEKHERKLKFWEDHYLDRIKELREKNRLLGGDDNG